jgi:DNA-binding response OmpR family regulator
MLPMLGGIEVLRALRRFSDVYIILLTPRTEEADRIVGLSTGTNDYLAAKIRALLYGM